MKEKVQYHQDLPVMKVVAGHHQSVPFILTREMFGGISVELAGAEISNLIECPVAAAHVHDVPEIYLLFSPRPGGAVIAVEVEDETVILKSPGALYVPAGKVHRFITKKAEAGSFCFGLFLFDKDRSS
ncbi:cupin domain-containing protein [Rhizorhapis suberifaciens]|uniref:Cupin domain-containing protein n=1 Tax=Rhizorhapis suberifaciens TaxID=13656 RepID=A0A840HRE6_9SPHN|nr:cupin domain-containing protein [Rhizorhapis suberifaciens]MBB4640209.1 hypothetical protein [Rhizorhapis suberifaciens]